MPALQSPTALPSRWYGDAQIVFGVHCRENLFGELPLDFAIKPFPIRKLRFLLFSHNALDILVVHKASFWI
jgi:hypothetical protein